MKKLIGAVIATVMVLGLAGCASNQKFDGTNQAQKAGRPGWAQTSRITFTEKFTSQYNAPNVGKGFYTNGYGNMGNTRNSEITARLNARSSLAEEIATKLKANAKYLVKADGSATSNEEIEQSTDSIIVGSRVIDSFVNEKTGEVWVLMYIATKDIKRGKTLLPEEQQPLIDMLLEDWDDE